MAYRLVVSKLADSDLDAILSYMATKLCNPKAASDYASEVEKRYTLIVDQPEIFPFSRSLRLRSKGYRKVVIDNFVMLYRIVEHKEEIFIARFFYGKRDYEKFI